ncbi:hypothetical protein, conserved [Plasmodium gonderi]|uniref:Uncharacterized protein n=1 Tax=Plasmodium gonderi TaxID=77519 RepID=A0A1Y1JLZ7_PLAGO|nr:hypothetical protein, conserved [Plasmodium gonderi]GAW81403.1 hypothetical protein, conserved [Plasmodium gonderi]
MNSLKKKKQDIIWGKKWRNLIQQKAIKEEMNKQLKASLEKQKQEEEEKECTFKPQTLWNQSFKKTVSFVDEFFVKLKPYIEQQQAYLNHLKELERDDEVFAQKIKEELRTMLSKAVDKDTMESIIEGYKGVRTRGMNKVKREKLDILSKMIKLEREYNCFMARENVDKKDLEECGFDCDLAAKLRNDILKNSLCPNSLRDFAKIRLEINQVLEEELKKRENEKHALIHMHKESNQKILLQHNQDDFTNRYDSFVSTSKKGAQEKSTSYTNERKIVHVKDENVYTGKTYILCNEDNGASTRNRSMESKKFNRGYNINTMEHVSNQSDENHTQECKIEETDLFQKGSKVSMVHHNRNVTNDFPPIHSVNRQMDVLNRSAIQEEGTKLEHKLIIDRNINHAHNTPDIDIQKNNYRNVYLNSNYMEVLKNEDAHKYVCSLQKDLNSVNVIIMNNNRNKNSINTVPMRKHNSESVTDSCIKNGASYYGEQDVLHMTEKNMNSSGMKKNGYSSEDYKQKGYYFEEKSIERKGTRYIDKNTYNIRNGNNFYDFDLKKNKKEKVAYEINPFYTNNMTTDARKNIISIENGNRALLNSALHPKDNCGHPNIPSNDNKPLFSKIMAKFSIS